MIEMICIVCPIGCHLRVTTKGQDSLVEGNQCERGREYAVQEVVNPTRTVTSTVSVKNLPHVRIPVKTAQPFPKGKMLDLMGVLKKITTEPPIRRGQVIVKNALDTGIDVVSTKTITMDSV